MKLRVKLTGEGQQPLVLLHGWGLNSGVWEPILAHLNKAFRVYCIDLPGYGLNCDVLPETYDLASVADMIAAVFPTNSILIGWSLGGLVATTIATRQPQKVKALGLIASSPCFANRDAWKGIKSATLQQFSALLATDLEKTVERFLAIQAMGSEFGRQDVKKIKALIMNHALPNAVALTSGLQILGDVDLRDALSNLAMPAFGIYGRLDSLVPATNIDWIAEQIPNFHYRMVEKASHAPFISHTEEFIRCFNELYELVHTELCEE